MTTRRRVVSHKTRNSLKASRRALVIYLVQSHPMVAEENLQIELRLNEDPLVCSHVCAVQTN